MAEQPARLSLYEQFRPVLPIDHAPRVGDVLNIVNQLTGLSAWTPRHVDRETASQLIQALVPISYVEGHASFAEAYDAIAAAITTGAVFSRPGGSFDAPTGELSCAACLRALGASDAIKKPTRSGIRTPDLMTTWQGIELPVEVVRPAQKEGHLAATAWMAALLSDFHALRRPFDLKIVCLEPLRPAERDEVLRTAHAIDANCSHESKGRWQLRTETPPHAPGVLWIGGFNHVPLPDWWPANRFALRYQFRMDVGLLGAAAPNPRTFGLVGLPFDGYLNPVRSKAERSQADADKPFLVGVDISDLFDADRPFAAELPIWFQQWDHISGVLAFRSFMSPDFEKHIYRLRLYANAQAKHPLPASLIKFASNEAWDADLALREVQAT